jgi:FkbM family methyltransferase
MKLAPDGRRISFAQNGEDIVLLRAFQGQDRGFWIDVGANHPVNDSVTKNFSDLGWSGINVEPVQSFFELLERERTNDVNINAALSDCDGTLVFHRNDSNLDLSSFDEELISQYRDRGDRIVDVEVPVMTLSSLCEHVDAAPVIDFLKIDTEGHELQVIAGHDFERWPVRVVVAEATQSRLPEMIAELSRHEIEFVTFDGLNAWFVRSSERDDLGPRLALPASPILDWYHPAVYIRMMEERDSRIDELMRASEISTPTRASLSTRGRSLVARVGRRLERWGSPQP